MVCYVLSTHVLIYIEENCAFAARMISRILLDRLPGETRLPFTRESIAYFGHTRGRRASSGYKYDLKVVK